MNELEEQIQVLESLLKEGNELIELITNKEILLKKVISDSEKKINLEEFNPQQFQKDCKDLPFLVQMEQLLFQEPAKYLFHQPLLENLKNVNEELAIKSLSNIGALYTTMGTRSLKDETNLETTKVAFYGIQQRGRLKGRYLIRVLNLSGQGLFKLSKCSNKMKEWFQIGREYLIKILRDEDKTITFFHLWWTLDKLITVELIQEWNDDIKASIRNKYGNMYKIYANEIHHRSISLNAKRLAIENYEKLIQTKIAICEPYTIKFIDNPKTYLVRRKCDKRKK